MSLVLDVVLRVPGDDEDGMADGGVPDTWWRWEAARGRRVLRTARGAGTLPVDPVDPVAPAGNARVVIGSARSPVGPRATGRPLRAGRPALGRSVAARLTGPVAAPPGAVLTASWAHPGRPPHVTRIWWHRTDGWREVRADLRTDSAVLRPAAPERIAACLAGEEPPGAGRG